MLFMNKIAECVISVALVASLAGCSTNHERIPSLCESFGSHFPIGVMINRGNVRNVNDSTFIRKHFNSLTCDEAMRPMLLQPRKGRFVWREADEVVDYAQRNNMKVRGSCLIRYDLLPDSNRMRSHIQTIMRRYKGKVYCWDVVGNAVADDTTIILRQNTWLYQIAGEEYVEHAFRCAHEADSTALLFYTDYNLTRRDKLERTCQMLQRLIDKGVHIDGVGLQGRWSLNEPTRGQLETAIARFRSMGLQVHIMQLDVSIYNKVPVLGTNQRPDVIAYDDETKNAQSSQYQMIFDVLRKNSDVVTSVTFSGLDDRSYRQGGIQVRRRKSYSLLFDNYRCPKQVFFKLIGDARGNKSNAVEL
jgi:endo-1,4-beta-xylanase